MRELEDGPQGLQRVQSQPDYAAILQQISFVPLHSHVTLASSSAGVVGGVASNW